MDQNTKSLKPTLHQNARFEKLSAIIYGGCVWVIYLTKAKQFLQYKNHVSRVGKKKKKNYWNKMAKNCQNPASLWTLCYCDACSGVHINVYNLYHYTTLS